MNSFLEFREKYPDFYGAVKSLRENPPSPGPCYNGHRFEHDAIVAAQVFRIASDDRTAEKAAVAAMLHSFDHCVRREHVREAMVDAALRLPEGAFTTDELDEIVFAALHHKELNADNQSLTQQVLMDADRLANMMAVLWINLGKCVPDIPTVDLEHIVELDPETTYREPKNNLDNMKTHFWYLPMFRLPKAIEISKVYAARMEAFLLAVETEFKELGLVGVKL